MSRKVIVLLSSLALFATAACDSDDEEFCERSTVVTNPDGKLHGERCEQDSECKYGLCYDDPGVTEGTFKICTKNGSCGDDTTLCKTDNTDTITYELYRGTITGDSATDDIHYCMPTCATPADCAAIDAAYTACELPYGNGVKKFCTTGTN